MTASSKSSPATKESLEPPLRQAVRVAGVLILTGTIPLALFLPIGPRLIWGLMITLLPLGFTVAGYYAWRRVCPLAFFATLGQRFKVQKNRKAGEWLATHGLDIQLGLLAVGMMWRHLGANSTPWALAGLFLLVVLAAAAVGFLFTGKTWCNHFCPVGVIEKIYQEPSLLIPQEANSQCATCTACKKNCPDIDLEQSYWKEVGAPIRRRVYYGWPGLILAFYCYFYLADGSWTAYLSGAWSRDPYLASNMLTPGFYFAPVLPRLAAVPLTFITFGLMSFLAFSLLERMLLSRARDEETMAARRHQCLSLAGFTGFILFYAFAGQSILVGLPVWLRQALSIGVVMVATGLLLRRWSRSEATFVQEKFAKGLLKKWEWGDRPPSQRLSDIYLVHQERLQQREVRLKAYKATVRDLLAGGILDRGNLLMLQRLRVELGISDKDQDKLMSELSIEEQRLFDPDYHGTLEKQLQLEQYRHELEALLLGGQAPEAPVVDSLQRFHRIRPEEHARIMDDLRGKRGPLVARLQTSVQLLLDLKQASAAADCLTATRTPPGPQDETRHRRLSFFHHVLQWRQRDHLEHILYLLEVGFQEPRFQDLHSRLASPGPECVEEVILFLGAMADQGGLGAALTPLAAATRSMDDPGPSLRRAAADSCRHLRASALTLLPYLADGLSDKLLREALMDPDPLVRETAQTLLAVPEELGQTLSDLAEDKEQWLLRAAVQSLPEWRKEGRMGASTLRHRGKIDPLATGAAIPRLALLETLMFLHGVPLFAELDPDDLELLASAATARYFRSGESLCRQGERAEDVYIILRGQVRTWVREGDEQPRSLGDAGAGACLGEMAVLDPAPRTATVTALTDVLALVLEGRLFSHTLHDHPAVAEGVIRVLARRLRSAIHGTQAF